MKKKQPIDLYNNAGISRRRFLGTTAGAIAAGTLTGGFPYIARSQDTGASHHRTWRQHHQRNSK